jgi:hypothetical protein
MLCARAAQQLHFLNAFKRWEIFPMGILFIPFIFYTFYADLCYFYILIFNLLLLSQEIF